jgi:predicted rRNA methylase YqxC with S4 and FtsJ domains
MKNKAPNDKATNNEKLEKGSTLITDSDIVFVNGNKDDFLGRYQMKLNKIKEKFRLLLKERQIR